MQAELMETACARLCLLTKAAWSADMPEPLTRRMVWQLIQKNALNGVKLSNVPGIPSDIFKRAEKLLTRSSLVSAFIESISDEGWVILLPEMKNWPKNLHKLKMEMPLFLFAKGNLHLVNTDGIAVAGSRNISDEARILSYITGQKIASMDHTLITGGANGVDHAAMASCLSKNGKVIIVPAMPASRILKDDLVQYAIQDKRFLMLCDRIPEEPFTAKEALSRNHTIYALGDFAIVVASRIGRGGTWAGATACLKNKWTTVFAYKKDGEDFEGNELLIEKGARAILANKAILLKSRLYSTVERKKTCNII